MSIKRRLLGLVLTVALVLAMLPLSGIGASASYTGAFQFDSNGKFRVMSLNDIQDDRYVDSRVIAMITSAITRYNPDLVVFVGDNVTGGLSSSAFKASADQFLQPLLNANTKYAVTFGNHDDQGTINKTDQYAYYLSHGGNNAVDHDVTSLTGVGSGVIPIYQNGQTSGTPAFQVYLMDSGTYASGGGYDCPYTDQIDYYIQRSITYPNVPSLWYQHRIVPDVYSECMTTTNNGSGVSFTGNGSPFSSSTYWLQSSRINWAKSGVATTLSEIYKEPPCPANLSTYQSAAHRSSPTYGSKTLYESWVAYGNMLGTYYGHDHKNSFVSTTADGIDIGFSKGATLSSYNDGNPGFRIYDLDVNGTYSSYNVTESDLKKAQIFFDANGGTGEMIPQFITKNSSANIKANAYTKTSSTFLGWATSPTGNVVYANGANYSIGSADVTLYAKWTATSNIAFNAGGGIGGTGPAAMAVGTALTAPAVTRTGYTLSSWSPSLPSTVPATDTTYTAQWAANTYTVNYNGNTFTSGNTVNSSHTYDTAKNLTTNGYTKVGYKFLGWSMSSSATIATYTDAQSVTNLTAAKNGVVTFYAVWQIGSYKMTFNADGGSGGTVVTKIYGTSLTAPTVTKVGHTFDGWDPEVPATVPGYDEDFVAQWTRNSYTITFNAGGGEGGASVPVLYGELPSAPTVSKAGHTFAGWNPAIVSVTESTTYVAQWNTSSYSINFDADGGTGGTGETMTFGTALVAPSVLKEGYSFAGWEPSVPSTVPAADTTYIAQWTPINFNITFDAAGGTGSTSGPMAFGSDLIPPVVARVGYAFNGWSPDVPSTVPASDVTYTAQWLLESNNLIFAPNGGTGGTGAMLELGAPITSPPMSRSGYLFIGWLPSLPSTVVEGLNTYKAQWAVSSFLITFDANGGAGGTSGMYQFSTHITAPSVTKPGYTFTGWSPIVPASVPGQNTTYTAQWSRNKIQIIFDANGGVGGTSDLMTFEDNLVAPTVTKPGYIFTGWSPAVPSQVVAGNRTYTAQWTPKS